MAVTKVVMPKLSEAMESGKVIKWLKKEGDRIQGGDIVAEVETDKADVEMEAFGAGVLRKILVPAGETAPIGTLIGVIAEPGDDIAALLASAPAGAGAASAVAPASRPATVTPSAPPASVMRPAAVTSAPAAAVAGVVQGQGGRVKASPLAKKIAAQTGVDLRLVQGSGPGGRIIRRDVEAAGSSAAPAAMPAAVAGAEFEDIPLSPIRVFHRAHIGIAVALEDGLITPVLRDCHAKPLARIAVESRDLAERARNRKLRVQELSGATFSISNLGMFDVTEFSAIINPPEGAILAVGSVRRVPVVDDTGLGVGRRMALTISCDHRVMDGAMGARFLQDVKRLLEEPLRLLV